MVKTNDADCEEAQVDESPEEMDCEDDDDDDDDDDDCDDDEGRNVQ